jgi:hypothetical protein
MYVNVSVVSFYVYSFMRTYVSTEGNSCRGGLRGSSGIVMLR